MTAIYKVHVRKGKQGGEITLQANSSSAAQDFVLSNNPGVVVTGIEQIAAVPTAHQPAPEVESEDEDDDSE